MYCAYTIPGMGGNSLMYYYNGKAVSGRGYQRCDLGELSGEEEEEDAGRGGRPGAASSAPRSAARSPAAAAAWGTEGGWGGF